METYEQQPQERVLKNLKKKAQALGFDRVAQPTVSECVS
jgi:transposase